MDRLTMYNKAIQLACEQIDACSCLTDEGFESFKDVSEDEALKILANQFLQEAADYNFGD